MTIARCALALLCVGAMVLSPVPARAQGTLSPPPLPGPPGVDVAAPAAPLTAVDAAGAVANRAPDPAPPAGEPAGAEPVAEAPVLPAITNVVTRDPFWPIGYVPQTAVPLQVTPESLSEPIAPIAVAPSTPEPTIEWPTLKVKGLTRGASGRQIALVDGVGLVEEGNTIHVPNRGVMYNWRVTRIEQTGVEFERLSADPIAAKDGGK